MLQVIRGENNAQAVIVLRWGANPQAVYIPNKGGNMKYKFTTDIEGKTVEKVRFFGSDINKRNTRELLVYFTDQTVFKLDNAKGIRINNDNFFRTRFKGEVDFTDYFYYRTHELETPEGTEEWYYEALLATENIPSFWFKEEFNAMVARFQVLKKDEKLLRKFGVIK